MAPTFRCTLGGCWVRLRCILLLFGSCCVRDTAYLGTPSTMSLSDTKERTGNAPKVHPNPELPFLGALFSLVFSNQGKSRVFWCFQLVVGGFLGFRSGKKSLVFGVGFLGFFLNTKERKINEVHQSLVQRFAVSKWLMSEQIWNETKHLTDKTTGLPLPTRTPDLISKIGCKLLN